MVLWKGLSEFKPPTLKSTEAVTAHSLWGGVSKFEALRKIRDLAGSERSLELAQMASRIASAMHAGVKIGNDPFHKAYCDKELSESRTKKDAKLAALENLKSSIDTKTAKLAQFKRKVAELQPSLGERAASRRSPRLCFIPIGGRLPHRGGIVSGAGRAFCAGVLLCRRA